MNKKVRKKYQPQGPASSFNDDYGELREGEDVELQNSGFTIIDGSKGEGGGQVMRISIGLAAILKKYQFSLELSSVLINLSEILVFIEFATNVRNLA